MPATSQHRVPPAGGAWAPAPRRDGRGSAPPPPSPFAKDAEWRAWRRARRERLPGWDFDADWLTAHALERLPRVLKALGCGKPVAYLPRPPWWFAPDLPAEAVVRHGLDPLPDLEPVVELPLEPGSDARLFVDMNLGEWDCPALSRRGADLVSLAAWRWGLTPAKAAWRLARTLGLGEPMP